MRVVMSLLRLLDHSEKVINIEANKGLVKVSNKYTRTLAKDVDIVPLLLI